MTSRIALLPIRGDPFPFKLTFHFFEKIWQDEVDKLFVLLDGPIEIEVVEFIRKFVTKNPKVVFKYIGHPIDHGPALTEMFNASNEDIVIFIESDSVIFKKGIVDKYCKLIEDGSIDCVGSPRGSCDKQIYDREVAHFHLPADIQPNYWPCFFFARRKDLQKTDLHFAGRNFKAGEYIPQLDWTVPSHQGTDTFVWMSIQLRALGLRFLNVEQYHGNLHDFHYRQTKTFLFDGICPWLHNGTLDSAIEDVLTDDNDIPLARRKEPGAIKRIPTLNCEKGEIERRVSWLLLPLDYFWNECDEISEFRHLYKKAIDKYIDRLGLDRDRIANSIIMYRGLIGL
ncbi:MAG: hypothetical protein EPN89_20175 [Methylovulum sp.]|nr:MAG: hypothetical protein EPN89_20175 [Methylovulum sp.]